MRHVAADLLDRRIQPLLVTTGDRNSRALFDEALRRGEPNAARSTSDEGAFT
jgi:hypothetical protein